MAKNELRLLVEDAASRGTFSGAVLVSRGDGGDPKRAPLATAVGYANRAWSVPNTLDTRFRVASASKMFTAVLTLGLVERGLLALDDHVTARLNLRGTRIPDEVTVRHLLTMTAGIADFLEESEDLAAGWERLCREAPISLLRTHRDYLPLFVGRAPLAAPGLRHQYSNASFILLGLLIEAASGRSYAEELQERVLEPAGMRETVYAAVDDLVPRSAEGYVSTADGGWRRNIYALTPAPMADGGAYATVADLVRFLGAAREGRLLGPAMTAELLQPRVVESSEVPGKSPRWHYGYGMFFLVDEAGAILRWGHTGEEEGASCRVWSYPQHGLDVAVLGNQDLCAGELMQAIDAWIREGHAAG